LQADCCTCGVETGLVDEGFIFESDDKVLLPDAEGELDCGIGGVCELIEALEGEGEIVPVVLELLRRVDLEFGLGENIEEGVVGSLFRG